MMQIKELGFQMAWPRALTVAAIALLASAPLWGAHLLSQLSYFRVRRVEVYGRHYVQPEQVLARLRVDTTASVWDDPGPLEERLAIDPQIRAAAIDRKLPGTLVVHLDERLPVAFVPGPSGLRAAAADGRLLPLDPSRVPVDLPVVAARDTALLRLLGDVRTQSPSLFDRINAARRTGRDEIALAMSAITIRAPASVSAQRLADIIPVERDLTRRGVHAVELDLRYRDQVIARLQ